MKNCSDCTLSQSSSEESGIWLAKSIMISALAYLTYISLTCPCRPAFISCHLSSVYAALAAYLAVLVYYNGFRVQSWKP